MRFGPVVAFATCGELPAGAPDDHEVVAPLAGHGIVLEFVVWDDRRVDWSSFDLVVVRSTWDYPARRAEFLQWAATVPRLANPLDVLAWSSDKHYLDDLAAAGVAVVDSSFIESDDDPAVIAAVLGAAARSEGGFVVKPAVGAGSIDAGRYEAETQALACAHAERLLRERRAVVVQPYLAAVDEVGETAVVFVEGEYSHGLLKAALLEGPARPIDALFIDETVAAVQPTVAQIDLARQALRVAPGGDRLLYARVDLVDGPGGFPVVLECELVEPSLFLPEVPGAAATFAAAIADRLSAQRSSVDRGLR